MSNNDCRHAPMSEPVFFNVFHVAEPLKHFGAILIIVTEPCKDLADLVDYAEPNTQFHLHFTYNIFIQKCFAQLFF